MNLCRLFLVGVIGVVMTAGCGPSSVSEAVQSPSDASAKQVQALENNPNMPQAQKDAIKARLEQQKKAGEAFANTQKK